MRRMTLLGGALLALTSIPAETVAQTVHGIVVGQTGLPLPGATLQLFNGSTLITSVTTGADGSFEIENTLVGDAVILHQQHVAEQRGFEPEAHGYRAPTQATTCSTTCAISSSRSSE